MKLYSSHPFISLLLLFVCKLLNCDDSTEIEGRTHSEFIEDDQNTLVHLNSVTTSEIIGNDAFFEIVDPPELEYTYRIRPAKDFGRGFTSDLRLHEVHLVPTVPADGCSFIKNYKRVYGNVALIDRGECSFLNKALNAETAGAKVVLVTEHNILSPEFDYYIEMVHDNSSREVGIPAGFLLGKNGRIIKETLKKLKRSYAVINLPQNLTFVPAHRINHPPWLTW